MFLAFPYILDSDIKSTADEDRPVILIRHAVKALKSRGMVDFFKICFQIIITPLQITAGSEDNGYLTGLILGRSPEPIIIMGASGWGKGIFFSQKIDGTGFSIIADKNYTLRLFFWGKCMATHVHIWIQMK